MIINDSTPPLVPFGEIHFLQKIIITRAASQIFNINTPLDWQVQSINHVLFDYAPLSLISYQTADGKSLVPLSVCTVKHKVGVVLVSLQGLGSDQVDKAIFMGHNIKA